MAIRNRVASEGDVRPNQFHTIVAAPGNRIIRNLIAGAECIGETNAVAIVVDDLVIRDEVVVRSARDRNRSHRPCDRFAIVREIVLGNGVVVAAAGRAIDDDAGAGRASRPIDEVLDTEPGNGAIAGLQDEAASFSPRPRPIEHNHRRSNSIAGLCRGIEHHGIGDGGKGGDEGNGVGTRPRDGKGYLIRCTTIDSVVDRVKRLAQRDQIVSAFVGEERRNR